MSSAPSLSFGYWDCRGLAAPILLALHYGNIAFQHDVYRLVRQEDGNYRSTWPTVAKQMLAEGKSPFPNLPYLTVTKSEEQKEGETTTFVQSNAILRYVARLAGIAGTSSLEQGQVDMLLDQVMDLRLEVTCLLYNNDLTQEVYMEAVGQLVQRSLPYYFEGFERVLKKNNNTAAAPQQGWLVGCGLTVADLAVWDAVDMSVSLLLSAEKSSTEGDWAAKYPLLAAHRAAVRALPQLESYFTSEASTYSPNNRTARWGNGVGA